jgi:hypothetical protein
MRQPVGFYVLDSSASVKYIIAIPIEHTMNSEGRSDPGVGPLKNVGKLKMMLRRKNACCVGRNRNRGQGAPTRGNVAEGTDSSNRVPSSGESRAKPDVRETRLTRVRLASRLESTRRPTACSVRP